MGKTSEAKAAIAMTVFIAMSAGCNTSPALQSETSTDDAAIVNGRSADANVFNAVAMIRRNYLVEMNTCTLDEDSNYVVDEFQGYAMGYANICSGTLVSVGVKSSAAHVITAAHCVTDNTASWDMWSETEGDETVYYCDRLIPVGYAAAVDIDNDSVRDAYAITSNVHYLTKAMRSASSDYDLNHDYDLAILAFDSAAFVKWLSAYRVQPIAILPSRSNLSSKGDAGQKVEIVGWGDTSDIAAVLDESAESDAFTAQMKATLKYVGTETGPWSTDRTGMWLLDCDGRRDSCTSSGDSGGPVIVRRDGRAYVGGISSLVHVDEEDHNADDMMAVQAALFRQEVANAINGNVSAFTASEFEYDLVDAYGSAIDCTEGGTSCFGCISGYCVGK